MKHKKRDNKQNKKELQRKIVQTGIAVILTLLAASTIFLKIFTGGIALWYDPARDLLLGWDNLNKLTLIGPPSGIPGVFYGPYWIWMISLAQLLSKDPRVVLFFIQTLPYLIFFPLILSKFSRIFTIKTIVLLWLLFLLGFHEYLEKIWNPYPAPLLLLILIYLVFNKENSFSSKSFLHFCLTGLTAGLIMNFHLSFGIGTLFGLTIYLIGEMAVYVYKSKDKLKVFLQEVAKIGIFFVGVLLSFLPFIIFEMRHHFQQTKTLINAFVHHGAVVSLTGLSQPEILVLFLKKISDLLQMPFYVSLLLFCIGTGFYLYQLVRRTDSGKYLEIKLLSLLFSLSFGVLLLYLSVKNPIWSYHLIGFEIIFLLLFGLIINRKFFFQIVLGIWIGWLLINTLAVFYKQSHGNQEIIAGNFVAEEQVVRKIQKESNAKEYEVYIYSTSIYNYEYPYVFRLLYHKDVPYRPELNPQNAFLVFLIIPPKSDAVKEQDFIHFRVPSKTYVLEKEWTLADGTKILKEVHRR